MENASKALLMAGGVLIALLVIGALMLMFNQLSSYQTSKSDTEVVDSISKYNEQFTRFADDYTKGYELITLMNKVIDNNQKTGIVDSVNFSDEYNITIKITLGTEFRKKYGITDKTLFDKDVYEIKDKSATFYKNVIQKFSDLETTYTLNVMSKLSANYDSIKNGDKTIKEITGKDININSDTIAQYREYSDFKTSTFKIKNIDYYKNGQIKSLSFEFKE